MDKTQDKIFNAYIKYVLEHHKQPNSVLAFTDQLKLKESTFYQYFNSFDQLEKILWNTIFKDTISKLKEQEVYNNYSVNEKLLAFYYSWIEQLGNYRSFVIYILENERIYEMAPSSFELFKRSFEEYTDSLINEGQATEEIAKRPMITDKYKYALWLQPISILKFWAKDNSEKFQDTDALIEKTVNFSFDLMRSNGLDSFFDLAKFHIQHK